MGGIASRGNFTPERPSPLGGAASWVSAVYAKLRQLAESFHRPGTFESLAEQINCAELQRLISGK